jgi:hypothetical protein
VRGSVAQVDGYGEARMMFANLNVLEMNLLLRAW